MKKTDLDAYAAVASLGLLGTVLALTLLPGDRLPIRPPKNDKASHAIAWAAMTLPMAAARPSSIKWVLPGAVAVGAAVELIQPSVGRSREAGDLAADLLGAATGCAAGWLIHRALSRR